MENEFKKQDSNGNPLPEEIGKGINELQAKKVLDARKQMVGVLVEPELKEKFKKACQMLELKQTDIFNLAINETIKKANEV